MSMTYDVNQTGVSYVDDPLGSYNLKYLEDRTSYELQNCFEKIKAFNDAKITSIGSKFSGMIY